MTRIIPIQPLLTPAILAQRSLTEIASIRGALGLPAERDNHFRPHKTIKTYAAKSAALGASQPEWL
jgi:hypothetical protein